MRYISIGIIFILLAHLYSEAADEAASLFRRPVMGSLDDIFVSA